jgi:hypothetical protein
MSDGAVRTSLLPATCASELALTTMLTRAISKLLIRCRINKSYHSAIGDENYGVNSGAL